MMTEISSCERRHMASIASGIYLVPHRKCLLTSVLYHPAIRLNMGPILLGGHKVRSIELYRFSYTS